MIWQKLLLAAGGGSSFDVSKVFSTDLYTGNQASRDIVNGLDLSAEGGLVWIKNRSATADHYLFDTARGALQRLNSNQSFPSKNEFQTLMSFNVDGFSLGNDYRTNNSLDEFVAWSFRKSPGFFNIVTYTGDGVAGRTVPHALGEAPGMIFVKSSSDSGNWAAYHRGVDPAVPENFIVTLNGTSSRTDNAVFWNDTAPNATSLSLGSGSVTNGAGRDYVAYLFAHNPDNGIYCGSYTGSGSSSGPSVNLGWEPQFVMIKRSDSGGNNWLIFDNVRGLGVGNDAILYPNKSFAEDSADFLEVSSSGFQVATGSSSEVNASGGNYIFMAIRAEGA